MSLRVGLDANASASQTPADSDKSHALSMPPDSGFSEMFSPAMPTFNTTTYCARAHADALDALPLLDAVIRETLRICPPVHGTIRAATVDDLIPISHPVVLRDGTVIQKDGHLNIRKGSYVHIPIEGLNFCEEIWGDDARKFKCVSVPVIILTAFV
jgi:cytochrome P450